MGLGDCRVQELASDCALDRSSRDLKQNKGACPEPQTQTFHHGAVVGVFTPYYPTSLHAQEASRLCELLGIRALRGQGCRNDRFHRSNVARGLDDSHRVLDGA